MPSVTEIWSRTSRLNPRHSCPRIADFRGCRIGTNRRECGDQRRGQLLERQTSTIATEGGDRRFDNSADALLGDQFGQPHHDVRIRDLLSNPDAARPSGLH